MSDKISIIIPAYNIEDYLRNTLDSVLKQSHKNIEVVVVNDGSRDGTAAIIDEYAQKDSRVKAIHKVNGGVTSARLAGVKDATGDWIGFVDGDDYIDSDMYERLLQNARDYNADISHCGYQMVFPNHVDYYYNTGRLVEQDTMMGLIDLLEGAFVEPGLCNKLYHRSIFDNFLETDKMPLDIKINEDLLMNYWLFKESKLAIYEDFCPYHYILRSGSAATSRVNNNKLEDPIKVRKIILDDVKGDKYLENVAWTNLIRQYVNLAIMPYGNSRDVIQPHKLNARKEIKASSGFVLKQKEFKSKLKIMVLWLSIWPQSYELVHKIYSRLSGKDKKYSIED